MNKRELMLGAAAAALTVTVCKPGDYIKAGFEVTSTDASDYGFTVFADHENRWWFNLGYASQPNHPDSLIARSDFGPYKTLGDAFADAAVYCCGLLVNETHKMAGVHHPEGESPFKVFELDADHPDAYDGAGWYWVTLCDDGTAAHEPLFGGHTADECYWHVADHKYVGGG